MEEQAANEIESFMSNKISELMKRFDEKMEGSDEVFSYLEDNFTSYLYELFEHALTGASEHEIDGWVATAVNPDTKGPFIEDVEHLNHKFSKAIN